MVKRKNMRFVYVTGEKRDGKILVTSRHVVILNAKVFTKARSTLKIYELKGDGRNPVNGELLILDTDGKLIRPDIT